MVSLAMSLFSRLIKELFCIDFSLIQNFLLKKQARSKSSMGEDQAKCLEV